MQFKKYAKLRKYVNGVATDEYKKGRLIQITDAASLAECEKVNTINNEATPKKNI